MNRWLILMMLMLSACVSEDRHIEWETPQPDSFPKLTAIGYATLDYQPSKDKSQRILMAMKASKLAAYRELAEQVYGQELSSSSKVNEWMLTDDTIQASVTGIIRGAKVVRSYPAGEHYVTELELDFSLVWALYQQNNRSQRIKNVTYF